MSLKQRKIKTIWTKDKTEPQHIFIILNRSDSVNDNRAHSHPTVHCIRHKTKKKNRFGCLLRSTISGTIAKIVNVNLNFSSPLKPNSSLAPRPSPHHGHYQKLIPGLITRGFILFTYLSTYCPSLKRIKTVVMDSCHLLFFSEFYIFLKVKNLPWIMV